MSAMIYDALAPLLAHAAASVAAIAILIMLYTKLADLFKE